MAVPIKPANTVDSNSEKNLERKLSDLRRDRQDALDALLRVRLEGKSGRALANARNRAQRALDALLAARLKARQ
jgi:hypothetical protein